VSWPKAARLRARFLALYPGAGEQKPGGPNTQSSETTRPEDAALLDLLADVSQPPDDALPETGVPFELERLLAPIFIRGEQYGTRASTLAYARVDGRIVLHERRFGPHGAPAGETRIET
jgi:uncharacterized protein with NRDE domain